MSNQDYATKADLASFGSELRAEMRAEMEALEQRLDAKMDMKFEYFSKKIVDDISGVLSDMMTQIDSRFNRLEAAVFRPNFRRWN